VSDLASPPGGQGDATSPKRSEIRLAEQALRQDWPIDQAVKMKLLDQLINLVDPDPSRPLSARTTIAAARAIAAFCKLTLQQQAQDLRSRQLELNQADDKPIKADVESLRDFLARLESGVPPENPATR
jgi:hypothetical protein